MKQKNKSGRLVAEGNLDSNSRRIGEWIIYHRPIDYIKEEDLSDLIKSLPDFTEIIHYKNGKKHGLCILHDWFDKYRVEEGNYHWGQKHGPWIYSYNHGKIYEKGDYYKGKRNGEWFYYDDDKNIEKVENYSMG